MTFLFTLDSHDLFGPFPSKREAHDWAYYTHRRSYSLLNFSEYCKSYTSYPVLRPNLLDMNGTVR